MQIWPAWLNEPKAPAETAASRSTSSSTISACGTGECDDADLRRLDDRSADRSVTGKNVQQSLRETGLLEDAGEDDTAADGGTGIWLAEHGVAQCQRRCDRPDGQDDRRVERGDDARHTDRHSTGEGEPGDSRAQQAAIGLGSE